jgi:hypothetical protein
MGIDGITAVRLARIVEIDHKKLRFYPVLVKVVKQRVVGDLRQIRELVVVEVKREGFLDVLSIKRSFSSLNTSSIVAETNANAVETNADATETNADAAETNADATETNADAAETNADATETNADATETNADATETNVSGTPTRTNFSFKNLDTNY